MAKRPESLEILTVPPSSFPVSEVARLLREGEVHVAHAGPDDEATLYAVAEKSAGRWTFLTLVVEIKSTGERIDLIQTI